MTSEYTCQPSNLAMESEVKKSYRQAVRSWTPPWRSLVVCLECSSSAAQPAAGNACRSP
jgi:hypothetical protein